MSARRGAAHWPALSCVRRAADVAVFVTFSLGRERMRMLLRLGLYLGVLGLPAPHQARRGALRAGSL